MSPTSLTITTPATLELIHLHLLSLGLSSSALALQKETGLGLTCSVLPLGQLCRKGKWGEVLKALDRLDGETVRRSIPTDLVLDVREMTVLELLEAGDVKMAKLALRAFDGGEGGFEGERKGRIDRAFVAGEKEMKEGDGAGFYGTEGRPGMTKQGRREEIGEALSDLVPAAPVDRLATLLAQAVKWQTHTGTLPSLPPNDFSDASSLLPPTFDIVNGTPPLHALSPNPPGTDPSLPPSLNNPSAPPADKPPSKQYGVVKFTKGTHCETATFLPTGLGLLTGSTDGFVEIYDPSTCKPSTLFKHQAEEEVMLHENGGVLSVVCSGDGEMCATGDETGELLIVYRGCSLSEGVPCNPNSPSLS